jgi:hypothetical protein
MTTLNLHSNELTQIPDDLLFNMKSLKEISFANNKLGNLTSEFLAPIMDNDLDFVDFRDNPSINCFFKKGNGGSKSLGTFDEVMQVIDSSCLRPLDESEGYEDVSVSLEEELIEVSDSNSSDSLQEETNSEDSQSFCSYEMMLETLVEEEQEDYGEPVFNTRLDCTYEDIQWRDDSALYTCCVTSASITEEGTIVDSMSGQHKSGKNHSSVQAVDLTEQKVEYFPRGLANIFTNLVALSIEKCGLKVVTRDYLSGLMSL